MAVKKSRITNLMEAANHYHAASVVYQWSKELPAMHHVNYEAKVVELVKEGGARVESGTRIALPVAELPVRMPLEEAIERRTSRREFGSQPLALAALARILYLANGMRNPHVSKSGAGRNVPNAGGLGSVELYVVALNVEDLPAGIYHFDSQSHDLALIKSGDFKKWVELHVCIQDEFAQAVAIFFLSSSQGRLGQKYGLRAYRLGLMDAGHVSQNIYLVCTALGLEVCATAGFVDDEVNRALNLDGLDNCALLALGIGKKD